MRTISIKTGLLMFVTLVAFFLLMFSLGLGYRSELSIFNIIIQLLFLYSAIKSYYIRNPKEIDNYMSGVGVGLETSAVGIGCFTLFFIAFLILNPALLKAIAQNSQVGAYLNPFTASFFIVTEGIVVSLIGSYILTRIFGYTLKEV